MKRTWSQTQEYGELGIIESVYLRNFMCHDNLSFDFDPHMNFIVGQNGSGKSAVLTGIILALGGKSGATGRFSNIKGFIKSGKSSATVSITLKNCGPDAYKPNDFGKKITVERHFNSDGVSSYKIKSHAGRIVSTSKEELNNILNIMDIQIENPTTVLTQDTSKTFLLSKNSKSDKLFQLFYKGTGLAKVHDDYNISLKEKEETKMELENKKAILPDSEKDIKRLKTLLQKSTKVTDLKKELLWAIVIELENRRDETKEALEKVKKEHATLKAKLDQYEADVANLQQTVASTIADRKASRDKIGDIQNELNELKEKRNALASEVRQIQGTCSSHEREVERISSEIQNLEKIIYDIQAKNQDDLNKDKSRHEESLNNLKNEISVAQSGIQKLKDDQESLRDSEANLQEKIDSMNAEIQDKKIERENIKKEQQHLVNGRYNRINIFGPEMANVLRKINEMSNHFKVKPKGPIGLYVNVKEPEWSFAVQECLNSRFLKNFICDNPEDADRLSKILDTCYRRQKPSIITTKFDSRVYDVSAHKTVCAHPTVLDMLDIEDPVIANCLIDQRQIENILLIADQNEACRLMLHNPPNKCRFAYTQNGDQYCHSPYRNYACRNRNPVCILKSVNEEDIRKKTEDLRELDLVISEKMKHYESIQKQLAHEEQEIRKVGNEITGLKIKLSHLHAQYKDEENSFQEPKSINHLQIDLEQLQKEKIQREESYTAAKAALFKKEEELFNMDTNLSTFQRNLQIEQRNLTVLNEKADELDYKKEKGHSTIKKIKDQLGKLDPLLNEHENDLSNNEATLKIATENARKSSKRIDTKRSQETISQIIKETEQFINQQRNCDQESLLKEYEDKVQKFNKALAELERLEKMNIRLGKMLSQRFQAFRKTCTNVSVALTCCFTLLLKENNFTGCPQIDFDEQTLEILAQPLKSGSNPSETSNLVQLSGGERSYVTIAFLLSLWDRIHMPFRILDEFDVFMDANNRHLSINLLVNTAKTNKKIQYIFLSPLELPDIEDSDHVKVHKMPPPRKR